MKIEQFFRIKGNLMARVGIAAALLLIGMTLSSQTVLAQGLQQALLDTNDFFTEERFRPYALAIDFMFFTMLFIAIYMIGVKYAFQRNRQGGLEPAEKGLAVVLGLMTAFLLVIGGYTIAGLLPFLPWILVLILFLFLYYLLAGTGMNKFLALILALILALLAAALLMQWLNPDADFLGGLAPIDMPSLSGPSIGSPGSGILDGTTTPGGAGGVTGGSPPDGPVQPSTPGGEAAGQEEPTWFAENADWWWALAILPLLLFSKRVRGLLRWKRKGKEGEEKTREEEKTLQQVKEEIQKAIDLKREIWKRMIEIMKRKEKVSRDFLDIYHKIISHPSFDPAYYLDKESEQYQEIMKENKKVNQLIELEVELMHKMLELLKLEKALMDNKFGKEDEKFLKKIRRGFREGLKKEGGLLEGWIRILREHYLGDKSQINAPSKKFEDRVGSMPYATMVSWDLSRASASFHSLPESYKIALGKLSGAFKELYDGRQGIVPDVRRLIIEYYQMTYKEAEEDHKRKRLTDPKAVRQWMESREYQTWFNISEKSAEQLQDYFKREAEFLGKTGSKDFRNSLRFKIYQQVQYLNYILKLIEYLESEKKSFTQLQEILVERPAAPGETDEKWVKIGERGEAVTVEEHTPIRISTRAAEGIPPFKVRCYVDKDFRKGKSARDKYSIMKFDSHEIGFLPVGTHTVWIEATSSKGTYHRQDIKSITINVTPRTGRQVVPVGNDLSFSRMDGALRDLYQRLQAAEADPSSIFYADKDGDTRPYLALLGSAVSAIGKAVDETGRLRQELQDILQRGKGISDQKKTTIIQRFREMLSKIKGILGKLKASRMREGPAKEDVKYLTYAGERLEEAGPEIDGLLGEGGELPITEDGQGYVQDSGDGVIRLIPILGKITDVAAADAEAAIIEQAARKQQEGKGKEPWGREELPEFLRAPIEPVELPAKKGSKDPAEILKAVRERASRMIDWIQQSYYTVKDRDIRAALRNDEEVLRVAIQALDPNIPPNLEIMLHPYVSLLKRKRMIHSMLEDEDTRRELNEYYGSLHQILEQEIHHQAAPGSQRQPQTEARAKRLRKSREAEDRAFSALLKLIQKEKKQVAARMRESRKKARQAGSSGQERGVPTPDELSKAEEAWARLNDHIEKAKKTRRMLWLQHAKGEIYALISLTKGATTIVGIKEGKRKSPYNRAKENAALRRGETGREPIGMAPDRNREDWETYQRDQQPQGGSYDPRKAPLAGRHWQGIKRMDTEGEANFLAFLEKARSEVLPYVADVPKLGADMISTIFSTVYNHPGPSPGLLRYLDNEGPGSMGELEGTIKNRERIISAIYSILTGIEGSLRKGSESRGLLQELQSALKDYSQETSYERRKGLSRRMYGLTRDLTSSLGKEG